MAVPVRPLSRLPHVYSVLREPNALGGASGVADRSNRGACVTPSGITAPPFLTGGETSRYSPVVPHRCISAVSWSADPNPLLPELRCVSLVDRRPAGDGYTASALMARVTPLRCVHVHIEKGGGQPHIIYNASLHGYIKGGKQ
jgi:hypothetical protein